MPERRKAKFLHGSPMRHVVVMTTTSALGMVAVFFVDFIDLYFISQLGEREKAALGYALPITFVMISTGIGLMMASVVLISNAIGSGNRKRVNTLITNILTLSVLVTLLVGLSLWLVSPTILYWLGARGETYELSREFLTISIFSTPFIGTGLCLSGMLRGMGEAHLPMTANLLAAALNAALDPMLIFHFDMGMNGAATATVIARACGMLFALFAIFYIHRMKFRPDFKALLPEIPKISFLAIPAMITSLANPVGDSLVTSSLSQYGDDAVAGWAIISRIIPVAFGTLFALSGAVGPIVGQNLAASMFDRVFGTRKSAVIFIVIYMTLTWIILSISHSYLSDLFNASGLSRQMVETFCIWLSPLFAFFGIMLVSNATFNNLGLPHYSTAFNWARTTIAAAPLIYIGGLLFGPLGIIGGFMASGLAIGCFAYMLSNRLVIKHSQSGIPPSKPTEILTT